MATALSERELKRQAAAGETSYEGNLPIRQRIARCIWFDQNFRGPADHCNERPFRTDDNQALTVFSPGWWNLCEGPDFRNAAIKVGRSPVVKGDVEVHLRASDWTRHGHDTDPRYRGVVLVVVLVNDVGCSHVHNAAGADVPQFTLEPHLSEETANLIQHPETM